MKPSWADNWVEETFDYGNQYGFMAEVGGKRQVVRTPSIEVLEPAIYDDSCLVCTDVEYYCDDCCEYHTRTELQPKLIKRAVTREIQLPELRSVAREGLFAYFRDEVGRARRFLTAAEKTILADDVADEIYNLS